MSTFSWLHFTDLHVGMTGASYLYSNVEEALFADLSKLHEQTGPWDAIFFTGDFVQKGAAQEFVKFDEHFQRLMGHIQALGSAPVLVGVPGNHDLVRPDPEGAVITALSSWAANPRIRDTFWTKPDSDYRQGVNRAFAAWADWAPRGLDAPRLRNYRPGLLPGDFCATLESRSGLAIGILGLNTAVLQLSAQNYEGKLTLHPQQLEPLFAEDGIAAWSKKHHACFLLTHHPIEWLDGEGKQTLRSEIAPPGRFALHLCGHLHDAEYTSVSDGGAQPRHRVIGRSLFGMEKFGEAEKLDRKHGYSVGQIEFGASRQFKLWPRASQQEQSGAWKITSDTWMHVDDSGAIPPQDLGPAPIQSPISMATECIKTGKEKPKKDFSTVHFR